MGKMYRATRLTRTYQSEKTSTFPPRKCPSQRVECYSCRTGGSFLRRVISIRRREHRCACDSSGVRPVSGFLRERRERDCESLLGVRYSSIVECLLRFARATPSFSRILRSLFMWAPKNVPASLSAIIQPRSFKDEGGGEIWAKMW